MSAFGGKADIGPPALQDLSGTGLVREPAYLGQPSCCRHWLETCSSVKRYYSPSGNFHAQLTCGHCNHDAGATAVRAQTRDTVIFGVPLYNGDEAVKKQCEEAAPKPAVSKSACMAAAAKREKDARDELTKIWNRLDSSIRLQCITNRSVDS